MYLAIVKALWLWERGNWCTTVHIPVHAMIACIAVWVNKPFPGLYKHLLYTTAHKESKYWKILVYQCVIFPITSFVTQHWVIMQLAELGTPVSAPSAPLPSCFPEIPIHLHCFWPCLSSPTLLTYYILKLCASWLLARTCTHNWADFGTGSVACLVSGRKSSGVGLHYSVVVQWLGVPNLARAKVEASKIDFTTDW